ncbi:hypothetical protein [Serratia microhaemolytica]|uniref:hypothetical protein n=1 Tax=Serratia microhaemolytica TaxID=2675110 RepID=UPI000FDEC4DF|nr:hypothetical protein [Serratia microhaemolytica]
MKYDPHLRTFVADDFELSEQVKQMQQQAEESNYRRLQQQLTDIPDENVYALLTLEEGGAMLRQFCNPNAAHWRDIGFGCSDPLSPYAGNIKDGLALGRIIVELRAFGITATEYRDKQGRGYIKISGYPGVRKILTGTRYSIKNKKILNIGIGTKGIENGIISGARFCLIFSAAYRAVELMLKDDYSLTDFFVNLSIDAAKLAVSVGVAWGAKAIATGLMVAGGEVIVIGVLIFAAGFAVTVALDWLDKHYHISETIIKTFKSYHENENHQLSWYSL